MKELSLSMQTSNVKHVIRGLDKKVFLKANLSRIHPDVS
jgi:hypothetical protein